MCLASEFRIGVNGSFQLIQMYQSAASTLLCYCYCFPVGMVVLFTGVNVLCSAATPVLCRSAACLKERGKSDVPVGEEGQRRCVSWPARWPS